MKVREIEKAPIDFYDAMNISQDAIMSRLNCHNVGKIIEFDSTTQTCTVQLMVQKQFYNEIITPAPITNVPLIVYGAGNAFITLPNPVGSNCLLMFLDRNTDKFLETGEMYTPGSTRTHDFTDCVAITTFSTLNNPISNYDATAISIINKYGTNINNYYTSDIKNYGNKLALNYVWHWQTNHTEGTHIEIANKIKIVKSSNDTYGNSLQTVIENFIDVIKGLQVVNGQSLYSLSTASKTALENYKSKFEDLFE